MKPKKDEAVEKILKAFSIIATGAWSNDSEVIENWDKFKLLVAKGLKKELGLC